ncbi:cell division transport system permease protein [Hephaestia caeni]|uniref:Cell division transport system permease protein n=1 Tax=Hephaestia caeni TaxID=645617 RepID=A0A397P7X9_9SPHN|nr:permease [Hephaestia caeni]RIA44433.1 cell division transport system permease protein [Hephaestia caeni]
MKLGILTRPADRRVLDDDRHTRAMRWIMAVMLLLTVLAAALGLGMRGAAQSLDRQLAGRLTVQIVEADARVRETHAAAALARLRAMGEVASAKAVDRAALAELLRPWLGADGVDPDLPMPALIDVDLADASPAAIRRVDAAITRITPAAHVDRHQRWMSPVSRFMDTLVWLAVGLVVLMAGATAAVVILAARAGLEAHRETIEVLHMMGSTDIQVARLFQRRIALDTLAGGIVGTVVAAAIIALVGWRIAALGSDLLGGVALGAGDWIVLVALPFAFALLALGAARVAVLVALGKRL